MRHNFKTTISMTQKIFLSLLISFYFVFQGFTQKKESDAHIIGHVVAEGEHLSYATVSLKGTTIGTVTDESGHFSIINVPEGSYTLIAQSLGFKPSEKNVEIIREQTLEVKFELEPDVFGFEEVVISADCNEQNRKESSVIINTISPQVFNMSQSNTLSEGLKFCSGLRMENNCQNCGSNQLRMNGMKGAYSQILINSRPIFSGLAAVYGLELIPSNMIERIEVVKGGNSSLFGSNAVAGTVNLVLKDPLSNIYEASLSTNSIGIGSGEGGEPVPEQVVNFNTSMVSEDNKTGFSVYGHYSQRDAYDDNGDGFSELSKTDNTTIGGRLFQRLGARGKLSVDFFNIVEGRRGGESSDAPQHETAISEALDHKITTGAITFDRFFRSIDLLSLFFSAQNVDRGSYYGANQSLNSYGATKGFTMNGGAHYKANFESSSLVFGAEHTSDIINDKKLGYPDIENAVIENDSIISIPHEEGCTVADQRNNVTGVFAQYEYRKEKFKLTLGLRYDHYRIFDHVANNGTSGNVLSPRVSLLYDLTTFLQWRGSYSKGYRAPQIFDEDLHVATSGFRQVLHENDPALKQETSHSMMSSFDFNKRLGKVDVGILIEGFYTTLKDPFLVEHGLANDQGVAVYTRRNAKEGAVIKGVSTEINLVPHRKLFLTLGYTLQTSQYKTAQNFGQKDFLRSPNSYGFLSGNWDVTMKSGISANATYTGKMKVGYYGVSAPPEGELHFSDPFFDLGMKVWHKVKVGGSVLQFFAGMKNIFNAYQSDFDKGVDRDPSYVYGPGLPRTIYVGLQIGNAIK